MQNRWQPLINLLSNSGYSVDYLAVPGFEKPLTKKWTLDDYADWLLTKIKNSDKNCLVIGHSFGGQISCRAAAAQPQNLQGLVLIAPAGIVEKTWSKKLKRTLFLIPAVIGNKLLFGKVKKAARKFLYWLAGEKDYYQASPLLKQTMVQVLKDEVRADLKKIAAPTLIFWGAEDIFTPVKNARIFADGINQSELILIPDCGHNVYYRRPHLLYQKIIQFLQTNFSN